MSRNVVIRKQRLLPHQSTAATTVILDQAVFDSQSFDAESTNKGFFNSFTFFTDSKKKS